MERNKGIFSNLFLYNFIIDNQGVKTQGLKLRKLIEEIGFENQIGKMDMGKFAQSYLNTQSMTKFMKDYEENLIQALDKNSIIEKIINELQKRNLKRSKQGQNNPESRIRHWHFYFILL